MTSSSIVPSNAKLPTDLQLLFDNIPEPLNIMRQGQYSSAIAALSQATMLEIAMPGAGKRASIVDLNDMQEKDPVVQQCIQLKALRTVQSFGAYSHPKKEIEGFINANLKTLEHSFKRTLFKMVSCVSLYGFAMVEYTFSNNMPGYLGQTRLSRLNVLDPSRIVGFKGRRSKLEYIVYDNGNGVTVDIPYKKLLHIINNSGATFNEQEILGISDGGAALNYYKLKRVVLTQLALATKNNSTGLLHIKTPNKGRTVLVDSKMKPILGDDGKPVEVSKQIALNYQLQDLSKRDYIVTDLDTSIDRLQITNDERFWQYILGYIDEAIQRAFGLPNGILNSGSQGLQNVGLGQNFKSVFDSTIFALVELLKEEVTNKLIKKLLNYNFPFSWYKNNYGTFLFDLEEDAATINSRLSTVSSLVASGILDPNDLDVISLIKKNLGLPALDETEKREKEEADAQASAQKAMEAQIAEMQSQLTMLQTQLQSTQTQQQLDMANNPPPVDPAAAAAPADSAAAPPEEAAATEYPEGA